MHPHSKWATPASMDAAGHRRVGQRHNLLLFPRRATEPDVALADARNTDGCQIACTALPAKQDPLQAPGGLGGQGKPRLPLGRVWSRDQPVGYVHAAGPSATDGQGVGVHRAVPANRCVRPVPPAAAAAVPGRDLAVQDRWSVAGDAGRVRRLADRFQPLPAVAGCRRLRRPAGGPDRSHEARWGGPVPGQRRLHHRASSPRRCWDAPGRGHPHRSGAGHRGGEGQIKR